MGEVKFSGRGGGVISNKSKNLEGVFHVLSKFQQFLAAILTS